MKIRVELNFKIVHNKQGTNEEPHSLETLIQSRIKKINATEMTSK